MSTIAQPHTLTTVVASEKYLITAPGEYTFALAKPGVELEICGAFQGKGKDIVEATVIIHHQAPHTTARTTLKGVGYESSKIKLVGRIIIDKKCPDTNSFLTERVLLLSDQAMAETVPDLEIQSDDVKCSHAASISHIPAEHLFYLQSRGISTTAAQELIVEGLLTQSN